MYKKSITAFIFICMSISLLVGCKAIHITDFDGMSTLPKNPTHLVFGTNSKNYDDLNKIYGDPIEYVVPQDHIDKIIHLISNVTYVALPEHTDIDLSPIVRYIKFYDVDDNVWQFYLGLHNENDRWYDPVNDDALKDYLYRTTVEQVGWFYTLEEAYNNKYLSKADLKRIAENLNERLDRELAKALSEDIVDPILETRAYDLRQITDANGYFMHKEATKEDVTIIGYYGAYEDYHAVMLQDSYYDYTEAERMIDIAGVTFHYSNGNSILIWKNN